MESSVKLQLMSGVVLSIDSNTPDMLKIVEEIVKNKDKIKADEIEVICDDNVEFDAAGFKQMIVKTVKEYLSKIKLNKQDYDKCINKLKE